MKLNQVIAIEKGVKSRVYSEISETHKLCQKPELFAGFSKVYEPLNSEGEKLPPEFKKVQFKVGDILKSTAKSMTELFDITAAKDWGNMRAVADVKVGDTVMISQAPVTYLLFLEKQLTDIKTFVDKLPELDEASDWERDPVSGAYKTPTVETHRTKKDVRVIEKFKPTVEHPGQADIIQVDVLAGYWKKTDMSGAIAKTAKLEIAERVEALIKAVKFAREEANGVDAVRGDVGEKIFNYIGF